MSRSVATPRPTCPQCAGACGMFVEHGVRGDFQVIHCEDVDDCCWYWVPDGAGIAPAAARETIIARVLHGAPRLRQTAQVAGVLAGRIAALQDDPACEQPEIYFEKIIGHGGLNTLVQIAFSIRNSRALCKCTAAKWDWDENNERCRAREGVMDQEDFDTPGMHDDRCPVGAAKGIILHALADLV